MPWKENWSRDAVHRRRHYEYFAVAFILIVVVAFVIGIYRRETGVVHRVGCAHQLKRLVMAMEMYNMDYGDYPPVERWIRGTIPYVDTLAVFICPADSGDRPLRQEDQEFAYSYWYVKPAPNPDDPAQTWVLGDHMYFNLLGNHRGGGNTAYLDGHVKWIKDTSWEGLGLPMERIEKKQRKQNKSR